MKIGRYQLENLTREGVRFLFVDFRTETERSLRTEPLFAKAMPMALSELQENLKSNSVPLDAAILLLDETGEQSAKVALELESQGFKNVYLVKDGAAGF